MSVDIFRPAAWTIKPGGYLRDLRLEEGLTIEDVATMLRMLRVCGFNRPWPRRDVGAAIAAIEHDERSPSHEQLLSLRLIMPFSVARFRKLETNAALVAQGLAADRGDGIDV